MGKKREARVLQEEMKKKREKNGEEKDASVTMGSLSWKLSINPN